ncbi:MAG: ferritin-like domain-containing protein, partial [Parafilimonas sp.]
LEQLEAAFYIMVTNNFYSGGTANEQMRFEQIMKHETAHREFFKTALGSKAIPDMEFDFSSINFSDRMSVLSASKTFEDTGVSAYNGIAYAIKTPDYLVAAGKIVSVEARHAAYIRDLIDPLSFADSTVIDSNGLDLASKPYVVVQAISPFLKTMPDMKSFPFNI